MCVIQTCTDVAMWVPSFKITQDVYVYVTKIIEDVPTDGNEAFLRIIKAIRAVSKYKYF